MLYPLKIFDIYNDFTLDFNLPADLLNADIKTFTKFIKEITGYSGKWKNFKDKNIFDGEKQFGYTEEDFTTELENYRNLMFGLIPFGKKPEEEKNAAAQGGTKDVQE